MSTRLSRVASAAGAVPCVVAGAVPKRSHLKTLVKTFHPKFEGRGLPSEMVRSVVEFAFHVGDYCAGEYEIARKYRSDGWDEKSYLRKLIKAANAEAVFSDD